MRGNERTGASKGVGGFMQRIFGQQMQEKSLMNQFTSQRNFEKVIQQQSSPFDQIMGGIGAVASIAAV